VLLKLHSQATHNKSGYSLQLLLGKRTANTKTPSLNWDKFWSGTDIWLSTLSHFVKSTQRFGSGFRFRHQV